MYAPAHSNAERIDARGQFPTQHGATRHTCQPGDMLAREVVEVEAGGYTIGQEHLNRTPGLQHPDTVGLDLHGPVPGPDGCFT